MNVLIDASNALVGGGVSYLKELLSRTDREVLKKYSIDNLYLMGVAELTTHFENHSWIHVIPIGDSSHSFIRRYFWKHLHLNRILHQYDIDMVFNPGGSFISKKVPYVTMCRNMLPFDKIESGRYGLSLFRLKLFLLRIIQSYSMKNAAGVIFISEYAKNYIENISPYLKNQNTTVIHHGISDRFKQKPKSPKTIEAFSTGNRFKILYISFFDLYKHQAKIGRAIVRLVNQYNLPVELTCLGSKGRGFDEYDALVKQYSEIIKYRDKVPFEQIQEAYKECDLFVYGSSCENMPNILIEAMSSGVPIVSNSKMPMPEFLGEGGRYFDIEDEDSIVEALREVICNAELRAEMSNISAKSVEQYSWDDTLDRTFKFLLESYQANKRLNNNN